ncbi:hypothetical protein DVH24_003284 [Malus domestica]|uniref:Uncharacterized protein n=1 Tax=Malus domestica TaxID=3750 RepID=A0A498IHB9_MALDO|nr:hypothetical protein DVH24_003284 [Malus domestica]
MWLASSRKRKPIFGEPVSVESGFLTIIDCFTANQRYQITPLTLCFLLVLRSEHMLARAREAPAFTPVDTQAFRSFQEHQALGLLEPRVHICNWPELGKLRRSPTSTPRPLGRFKTIGL